MPKRTHICRATLIDPADCGLGASQLSNVRRRAYFKDWKHPVGDGLLEISEGPSHPHSCAGWIRPLLGNARQALRFSLFCRICAGLLFLLALPAHGATWNDLHGMGGDDAVFGGCGAALGVITSVHSNALYWINAGSGAACWERVLVKSDLTGYTVDFYVATNTWLLASNQMAGTNILWLSSTNASMATNDLLVYRGAALQLTLLSGDATDAAGLVFTNTLGQCAIKLFNPLTNAVTAGESLHKLARVQRWTPLSDHTVTNKVLSPWANWLNLSELYGGQPLNLQAKSGQPSAVVLTYSNAAGLQVAGRNVKR